MENNKKPVQIKALTYIQQCEICHILAVGLENARIACPEDVYQTDRGNLASPEIIENLVSYLKENNLIEIND